MREFERNGKSGVRRTMNEKELSIEFKSGLCRFIDGFVEDYEFSLDGAVEIMKELIKAYEGEADND